MQVAESDFKDALSSFATGVTVVTTRDTSGNTVGLTVNSFASVSLTPPLILWSLRTLSRLLPVFRRSEFFAVNVLGSHQSQLSSRFSSSDTDKFAGVTTWSGPGDVPVIADCCAILACRKHKVYEAGDHSIFIGEVLEAKIAPEISPLVLCRGAMLPPPPLGKNRSVLCSSDAKCARG
jgi:3-hydroxy-9,10-secoandrosta-1,3,5(10)-triene-9,17-dione monooxygenase reductase component